MLVQQEQEKKFQKHVKLLITILRSLKEITKWLQSS